MAQSGTPGSTEDLVVSTPNIRTASGDFVSRRSLRAQASGTAVAHAAPRATSAPSVSAAKHSVAKKTVAKRSVAKKSVAKGSVEKGSVAKNVAAKPRAKKRGFLNLVVMTVAAGLVATMAIPAYAVNPGMSDGARFSTSAIGGLIKADPQSLAVSGQAQQTAAPRDPVTATTVAALAAQKAAAAQQAAAAASVAQFGVYSTASLIVSNDARQLAQTLMAAYQSGTFTDYTPAVITTEIGAIANGTTTATCAIDTRILQILVLTINQFGSVGISDLNRPCMGSGLNCSVSSHCVTPTRAVDFTQIGGQTLDGSNPATIQLLRFLDGIVPPGSNAGQSECRASAGTSIVLSRMAQFSDSCSHQHLDIPL
ncbi:MAG: hypothetical protein ABI310_04950 [Microbacteriaceae bacterium]